MVGLALLGSLGLAARAAHAEDEPGVARVSFIEGEASYLRGDADDWTGVAVNAPLVTGDRFYSGADTKAEIQLDPAVYARLSSETEVSMLELGPDTTQVRMSLGLASFRVRRDPSGKHVEIDTPGAAVVVQESGVYRVAVDRNGDTNLQVRGGEATVYVAGEKYQVGDGRAVAIEGIGDAARPRIYAVSGDDGWDEWEQQRAQRVEGAVSAQYVSDGIYGVEDLDEYGDWEYAPEYGNVWRPRVSAGWAPYTDGRWVWVDPWGWTWLDYSSWGWAPFHYGRWVYWGSSWAWAPGPIIASPVYAPALVGWFGGGWGGVSVGIGFGSIGWTPLGWGEPCFPWWGGWGGVAIGSPWWGGWGGPRIWNNTVINKNITNININNYNFGNLRHRGGFSTVPVGEFRNGRGRITPVGSGGRGDFRPIGGRVPVTPTRDSLPATNPSRGFGGRTVQPPAAVDGRRVVTARTPTTSGQPSFDRKLPVLEQGRGTPLTPARMRELGDGSGRTPLVQNVANPDGTVREARTLPTTGVGARDEATGSGRQAAWDDADRGSPGSRGDTAAGRETTTPGEWNAGREYQRAGVDRAGGGRQSMSFPGREAVGSAGGSSGGRTVARPPGSAGGEATGRAMPVAPRDGGSARTPYVARRPAWNDASSPTGGSAPGRATTPRTTASRPDAPTGSAGGYGGGRSGTVPRTTTPSYGSAPSARSANPGGSAPQARSLPGGSMSRSAPSQPRSGYPSQGSSPSVRSAPGSSSRSYLSQPRTAARAPQQGSRGYAGQTARVAPRSPSGGDWSRGGSQPQMRSAPSAQMRAPAVQSAPRSAPSMRSSTPSMSRGMPSMSGGGGMQRSAPSAMARGYSGGGAGGGSMSRGMGGSGGGMSGFGGGRSFGGGGRSGG